MNVSSLCYREFHDEIVKSSCNVNRTSKPYYVYSIIYVCAYGSHFPFSKTQHSLTTVIASIILNNSSGDLLYIPIYWWHQIRSYGDPNIAVGIWFKVFDFDEEFQRREVDENEQVIKVSKVRLMS